LPHDLAGIENLKLTTLDTPIQIDLLAVSKVAVDGRFGILYLQEEGTVHRIGYT
jgi:hypothetical protein